MPAFTANPVETLVDMAAAAQSQSANRLFDLDIATVLSAAQESATVVFFDDNAEVTVTRKLEGLPALSVGDRVLVMRRQRNWVAIGKVVAFSA